MPCSDDEGRAGRPKQPSSQSQTGRRKRMRVFTPDDRASHRVVEKQRREALNTQFIELARLLPGLATTRRLSKSIIVSESIVHQKKQREQRLACAHQVRTILAEQESLLVEVNSLRHQLGIAERREGGKLSGEVMEVLKVEEEVFGTFPAGFGDNGEEANDGDEEMGDVEEERRDSSSVRRSRRSASRSMSNASNRTSSRSPTSSTRGAKVGQPVHVSPSPPAQSESSPGASVDAIPATTTVGAPPVTYDADFLAIFANASSSIPAPQLSFGFPPTTNMVSQSAAFANQLPLGLAQKQFDLRGPDVIGDYIGGSDFTFPPPGEPQQQPAADDIWRFLQQHPSANLMHAAGLLDAEFTGVVAEGTPYSVYPSVHLGTHGGFVG
ncbi:hypothetical protein DFH07DRAFT_815826 [Mycena maculata]|uniref:BHLH domain-containing protein n=1 Tax=Mycena maculata TaxID=230809 RepID=A0AAD7JDQ5_9AGAR|nr:hypothetical protein DFH07DRAFT_815826 [Mycena maculata]